MIAYLRGKVLDKLNNALILDVNDIGYKVFTSSNLLSKAKKDSEIDLYVFEQISQNQNSPQGIALYGMKDLEELEFFELLTSVSGIGPKTALGALDVAPINEIKISILEEDIGLLSQAPGIGKKTAQRALLELKNKIGEIDLSLAQTTSSADQNEELEALMSLGYTNWEAREALKKVDESESAQFRIKEALKILGK